MTLKRVSNSIKSNHLKSVWVWAKETKRGQNEFKVDFVYLNKGQLNTTIEIKTCTAHVTPRNEKKTTTKKARKKQTQKK
jgi:hypothetical protein